MDVLAKQLPFGSHQFLSELLGDVSSILGGGGGGGGKAGSSVQSRDVGLTGPQFVTVSKNAFASVNKATTLAVKNSQKALEAVSQRSLWIPLAAIGLVGLMIWKERK